MAEAFQVIFNSQGSNVLNNGNINAVVYNVNWGAFLPKKYKKFHCQFVFKSINVIGAAQAAALVDNGFVSMNIGRLSVYDGLQMSTNLGIIYPVFSNANSSFYNSTNNDNNDFWIDYPINNTVTVTIKTFAGGNMAGLPHYVLMLNLIGITDDDLGIK